MEGGPGGSCPYANVTDSALFAQVVSGLLFQRWSALRARGEAGSPEPPIGPWRVAQNAGAQRQPRFVEYWEGPLPEQYGARWEPNGFPSAEEAQAVCDALNALHQREAR